MALRPPTIQEIANFKLALEQTFGYRVNDVTVTWEENIPPVVVKGWDGTGTPGITNEQHGKMNILPSGERIGWDEKDREYRVKLDEALTLGYITQEEYESRVEWLKNSKSRTQAKEAVKDLASVKVPEPPKPVVPVPVRKRTAIDHAAVFASLMAAAIGLVAFGGHFAAAICFPFLLVAMIVVIVATRTRK